MRREIPLVIALSTGLLMIFQFFTPVEEVQNLGETLPNWNAIIGGFAIFLALTSLIKVHGDRISRRDQGWGYSVVLLLTLGGTIGLGLAFRAEEYYQRPVFLDDPSVRAQVSEMARRIANARSRKEEVLLLDETASKLGGVLGSTRTETLRRNLKRLAQTGLVKREEGPYAGRYVCSFEYFNPFHWIYQYVYSPLQATMVSILAFFVASAAYRAFRARTVEGSLLLAAALFVMIGRVSFGYWTHSKIAWLPLPEIQQWILDVPNTAAQRAIMMGSALGIISSSLRILLGYEQTYLGND